MHLDHWTMESTWAMGPWTTQFDLNFDDIYRGIYMSMDHWALESMEAIEATALWRPWTTTTQFDLNFD